MRNEFTALVERDRPWHIAYCPESPGANGQDLHDRTSGFSEQAGLSTVLAGS